MRIGFFWFLAVVLAFFCGRNIVSGECVVGERVRFLGFEFSGEKEMLRVVVVGFPICFPM